jgi:hypothetical protein
MPIFLPLRYRNTEDCKKQSGDAESESRDEDDRDASNNLASVTRAGPKLRDTTALCENGTHSTLC